jgi:hypothetical protein
MDQRAINEGAPRKRAYKIRELKEIGGPGHAKAYEDIRAGRLRAVKNGRSTLILAEDFERYLASLPAITSKSDAQPESKPGDGPVASGREIPIGEGRLAEAVSAGEATNPQLLLGKSRGQPRHRHKCAP